MIRPPLLTLLLPAALFGTTLAVRALSPAPIRLGPEASTSAVQRARELFETGKQYFRHDTFGSEAFWGDELLLHEAIAGAANGGVGPGVSPSTALGVGLKVDAAALPQAVKDALANGQVDLDDPAVTLDLLRLDSVVGVRGFFDDQDQLASVGIQCSLCHSSVDDSFAPGIGERLDGWPNRDLDVGTILSLAPDVSILEQLLGADEQAVRDVLRSWGPGRFDAHLLMDGQAFRPDGKTAAVLIPAAFGLAGVNLTTYTGWGAIAHWNAFVGNLEMHGKGTFHDERLNDPVKYPVAAMAGFAHVENPDDRITPALAALQFYQLALPVPEPAPGSFDPEAAERGEELFAGAAGCAACHVPPIYTEPGWNMHRPDEIGIDDFQSSRSPDERYRTTPLAGLAVKAKGGYYHDGRFADLDAVVEHYDAHFGLALLPRQKHDLVEFLKSL